MKVRFKAQMPLDVGNSQEEGRRGEPIVSREKQGAHASREFVRSSIVPHSPLRARAVGQSPLRPKHEESRQPRGRANPANPEWGNLFRLWGDVSTGGVAYRFGPGGAVA